MNGYQETDHLIYNCRYHVIFCPKYRRRILKDGLDVFVKNLFLEITERYQFDILEMEVMPDHIHLLISPLRDHELRKGIKAVFRTAHASV